MSEKKLWEWSRVSNFNFSKKSNTFKNRNRYEKHSFCSNNSYSILQCPSKILSTLLKFPWLFINNQRYDYGFISIIVEIMIPLESFVWTACFEVLNKILVFHNVTQCLTQIVHNIIIRMEYCNGFCWLRKQYFRLKNVWNNERSQCSDVFKILKVLCDYVVRRCVMMRKTVY